MLTQESRLWCSRLGSLPILSVLDLLPTKQEWQQCPPPQQHRDLWGHWNNMQEVFICIQGYRQECYTKRQRPWVHCLLVLLCSCPQFCVCQNASVSHVCPLFSSIPCPNLSIIFLGFTDRQTYQLKISEPKLQETQHTGKMYVNVTVKERGVHVCLCEHSHSHTYILTVSEKLRWELRLQQVSNYHHVQTHWLLLSKTVWIDHISTMHENPG